MFNFRKLFKRTLDAPPPARPAFALASLQWSGFEPGAASGCVLCQADFIQGNRLRQLVGLLPISANMHVTVLSQILGVRIGTISRDLNLLKRQFGLPIKCSHRGFMLTAPVALCKSCTLPGEQVRQTERFRNEFKVSTGGRFSEVRQHNKMKTTNFPPPGTHKAA